MKLHAQNDEYIIVEYNGKYVLQSETQDGTCYKATNDYKKIIVEENVKCIHTNYNGSIDEEEILEDTTVKNYFKNFKSITTECRVESLPNYNFQFENGKCIKITIKTNLI